MIKKVLGIVCVAGFLCSATASFDEPLKHVGVSRIYDAKIQRDFAGRFNAKGEPFFLITNIQRGIAIGDMIRFDDKVVLIDAEVWQTMKSTNVLELLKNAPVISIKAKAESNVWASRESQAAGEERKAYTLGAAFLNTMEERFSKTPTAMELVLRFEGSNLVLEAPREMLKSLTFKTSDKRVTTPTVKTGSPEIVTGDRDMAFKGQEFNHEVWAIDLEGPGKAIRYNVVSELPEGLDWDAANHTISGKARRAGVYKINLEARNDAGRIDKQVFTLTIRNNEDPKILGNPESIVAKGSVWEYTPIITDPDHLINTLTVKAPSVPEGMRFDPDTYRFTLKPGLSIDQMKALEKKCFSVQAKDPIGGLAEKEICFNETSALAFKSSLSSNKLAIGQASYYRPVATGPSQKIKYKVYDMENNIIDKDKVQYKLNTDLAGSYGLLFVAEDDMGNKANQLVSYKVEGAESNWHGGGITVQHFANNVLPVHMYYRYGGARLGLYFPNATENIPNFASGVGSSLSLMDIPFVIAGLNATGEKQESQGNTLFIEGGMKLWATDGILAGGFMLRLDGQYNSYQSSDLVVEYKVQYFANQSVLLYDHENVVNNEYGRNKVNVGITEVRQNEPLLADDLVDTLRTIHSGLDEMLDNYANENNDVFLIDIQTWFRVKNLMDDKLSIWAAPVYWYEDHVYSSSLSQHGIAVGAKGVITMPYFIGDVHLLAGMASGDGPTIRGGASLYFGRVTH